MHKRRQIRKRKSFMFTSRHYSLLAVTSTVMGIASLAGLILSILIAFSERGKPPVHLGGVGFFSGIGNLVGIACAMCSLNERDIFKWVSYLGLALNMLGCLFWVLVIFYGI